MNFGSFGFDELGYSLFMIVFIVALSIWPAWRIVAKTGNAGALSLGLLVPVLNIILIFYIAFSEWPIERELKRLQSDTAN